MSFLSDLQHKKDLLKPVQTVVTNAAGHKFLERKNSFGLLVTEQVGNSGSGFVVDDKPDLQVAQILDYLFLGSQDPVGEELLLKNHGITHVLSIGVDVLPLEGLTFRKIDLLDLPEASLIDALNKSVDLIDSIRKQGKSNKVYVHCNAGYSRSPAIVIGYLMKTYKYSLEEAVTFVNRKRHVKPNDGFMKQLKRFGAELDNA